MIPVDYDNENKENNVYLPLKVGKPFTKQIYKYTTQDKHSIVSYLFKQF
jgi:hypothetical protein